MSDADRVRRAGREIWVVRHGETAWSAEARLTGRSDVPLTARGEAQARALGALLAGRGFARVLASPLVRARETGRLAGFSCGIDEDLVEWDFGAHEGRLRADVARESPGWSVWGGGFPRGETADEVGARAARVLARVRAAEGDVLLFAHGYLLRVLAALWLGQPPGFGERLALDAGRVGVLGWEYGVAALRVWNVAAGHDPRTPSATSI